MRKLYPLHLRLINQLSGNLLYKKRFFLIHNGCLHNIVQMREWELARLLDSRISPPPFRAEIMMELFGDKEKCRFSRVKHLDATSYISQALAIETIARLGKVINVSYSELSQMANLLATKDKVKNYFIEECERLLQRGEMDYLSRSLFCELFAQEDISREISLELLPIFIAQYNILNPKGDITSIVGYGVGWELYLIIQVLIEKPTLLSGDLLALAYNGNPAIRQVALLHPNCPPEARIVSSLMGLGSSL